MQREETDAKLRFLCAIVISH